MEWLIEARLKEKFHYSVEELNNMDYEQYLFLIGILEADCIVQKKESEKAKKNALNKRR